MATVNLNRPAANSTTVINELGERYILNFPGKEVMLTKVGDSLVYGFDDGGRIIIENFYAGNSNSKDSKFELEGKEFDAEKFFTAMDEPDLIPAAGPAPKKEPADTNSYHEYGNIALASGIDHLNGLDYRSSRAFEYEEARREPGIINNDTDATTAYMQISQNTVEGSAIPSDPVPTPAPAPVEPEPIAPSPVAPAPKPTQPAQPQPVEPEPVIPQPEPVDPEPVTPVPDPVVPEPEPVVPDPVVPDPDPVVPTPVEPEIPTITAREDQIAEGTPNPVIVPGFEIVEVVKNGDKGTLEKDPDTGEWKYTLKDPVDHPEPGKDTVPGGDTLVVKVKDPDGNETEIEIPVDIVDDTPEVGSDHKEVVSGNPDGVTGDVPFDFGADDGPDKDVTIKYGDKEYKPGDEIPGEHGKLVVDEDGSYKYIPDPKGIDDPETSTDEFTVIVKDSDGDEAEGKITIDIKKPEGPVADPAVIDESLLSENGANAAVSIDGYTIVEVVGNGNNGSLAQNENGEWVYELADNITHTPEEGKNICEGVDFVTLKVRDKWGNEYLVEKRIDVIDDVPEAGIENGEMTVVAGQQVSGGSLTVDFGEDDLDARSVTVTVGERTETLNWGEENKISGEYGTLIIGKDGGFTYKANGLPADKTGGRDEFTFTVTDSDGDSVDVDANGQPLKISVDVTKPEAPKADPVEAKESGIKDNETSDVPDDKYEIVEVIENGEKGTLEQDPDTGEWKYTLEKPAEHDDGYPDRLPDGDTVKILVRTPDGNEFVIDQPITIVDDVPEIGDGVLNLKSGETGSGSVDKFDFGADKGEGKGVSIVDGESEIPAGTRFESERGYLTINEDGTYTYEAKGLDAEHASATDTFTVKIKDADGDTDTGTITVNITKPAGPAPDEVTIHEKDMSGELTVDGYTVIGVAGQGEKGTVSETEDGFVYTLTDNLEHPVAGEADTIKGADTVRLIVRDAKGNEYIVEKTINVVDDLPTATIWQTVHQVSSGAEVTIDNQLKHDFGADNDEGKTSITSNGVEMAARARIDGQFGTLTVNSDGKLTYHANGLAHDQTGGSDTFAIVVTDSDGDSVSVGTDGEPLQIVFDVAKPEAPVVPNIPVAEEDIGNPDGSVPVEIPGYEIVKVVDGGNGEKGTLVQDPDTKEWSYTLEENSNHPQDDDLLEGGDTVKILVRDPETGNEWVIEQKFDISDDTPDAGSDERTIQTGESVTSSVLIDFGADNKPVDDGHKPSVTITVNGEDHKPGEEIRGEHGTLTIDEKGGYTYTADPKDAEDSTEPVKDIFTVTVRDSDGDEAEGTITINVTKPAGPTEQEITVNERGLDDAADASESAAVDFGDYTIIEPENGKYEGGKGTLELVDGQWKYTLSGNMDSGANAEGVDAERNTVEGADTIAVVVEDANHNRFTVNVKVNVVDDIPEAGVTQSVSETTAGDAAGVTGSLAVDFGADDDAGKTSVRISVNGGDEQELVRGEEISGKYGKLVVGADGGYKYVANTLGADETGGRDEFAFAVIDSDGDRVTVDENNAPLKISVDVKKPEAPTAIPVEVAEENIGGENATVSVTINGYEIVGIVPDGNDHKGEFVLENGKLTYTLTDAATHEKGGESDSILKNGDSVTLIVRDANGNEYKVVQTVNIRDDNPDAGEDAKTVAPGAEVSGEILIDFGADDGPEKSVTITIGENEAKAGDKIEGKFGKLTLNEDGTYTYVANSGSEGGQDVFEVVVRDADGDEAAGKITINVEKPSVIPSRPNTIDLEDEHLVVDEKDMASDEGAKAGIAIIDKAGKEYTISEVLEDGYFGNVVQNEDGSWSYNLNTAFSHDVGDGRNTQVNGDYVRLKVVDEDGNEYVVNRKVDIIDDIPEMSLSECDLGKVMAGSESAVTGKLEYGFGADAGDGAKLVVAVDGQEIKLESGKENVIQGKYGELVIAADGSYAYRATVNAAGQDSFQFRIEDADGDIVDADASGKTFDVVVNVVEKKEPEPGEITVNERDLRGGGTASADLTVDGFEIVGVVANGARGEAALVDGKWVYTLDGAIDHPEQGTDTAKGVDTVTLKVRDEFGNEYEVVKTVNVIDDTPEMSVTGGGTIRSGETASGTLAHEFGADSAGQLVVSFGGKDYGLNEGEETVINGKFGDLTFNGDGTWDYKANEDNRFGRDNFQLKIVDGDGDVVDSEAGAGVLIGEKKPYEIDINVLPENVDVDPSIIYEQELAFGDIKLDVDIDGWTIVGATPQGHAGTMVKDAQGNWQYVLKNALNHDNGVNIVDTVRLTLKNENGVTVEVDKRIDIVDDKPRLSLVDAGIPIADGIVVNERDLRYGGKAYASLEGEGYEILSVYEDGLFGKVQQIDGEWVYQLNGPITHAAGNSGNVAQKVDYIYLKVKDENGFVRKIEVPVDVVDDAPDRNIYLNAAIAPGESWSMTIDNDKLAEILGVDEASFVDLMGGDGTNWKISSSTAKQSDMYNRIGITANDESVTISASLPSQLTYSNEFIYNTTYTVYDTDGDSLNIYVNFNRIPYDVEATPLVWTSGDDIINPNPRFHYTGDKDTDESYWTDYSEKNIIYGLEGNDTIFGEELYIAADETYEDVISRLQDNQYAKYYPDLIYGGSGDDVIYLSGAGGMVFGDGTDLAGDDLYSRLLDAIGVECEFYDLFYNLANLPIDKLLEISARVESLENISDGDDIIYGNGYSVIFGNGGNDQVTGTGNKIVFGGSGNDWINGIYAFGGSGDDFLSGTYVFGETGNDRIAVTGVNGRYSGGEGNDIFFLALDISLVSFNSKIYGGSGLDIITSSHLFPDWINNELLFNKDLSLSYYLQNGYVKDVEILVKEKGVSDAPMYTAFNNGSIKNWLYSGSEHQIIHDEDTNTLSLGSGWSYLVNSETGTGAWHTKTYIYEDADGRVYTLETTLEVTNIESKPNEWDPHKPILSGHESEIEGRLDYSFGADSGAGAKLTVFVNGEEFTLKPGESNTVTGKYGVLIIAENGIFSYKAKPNMEGTDEFQFQIQDSDGNVIDTDVAGNPLKILVDVEKPELPVNPNIGITESKGEQSVSLEIPGYTIIDISMDSDVATLQGNSYTISGAFDHSSLEGSHTDTVHVTYQDRFGNTYEVDRNISVGDTGVHAGNIAVNLTNVFDYTGSSENANDKQLFYEFGADDDPDKISITYDGYGEIITLKENVETTVRGKYGDLTFTLSGGNINFHYDADEDAEVWDTFNFTFTDADGSSASNKIDIKTRFSVDLYEREMTENGVVKQVKLPEWMSEGTKIIDVEYEGHAGYAYQDEKGDWYYRVEASLFDGTDNPADQPVSDELIIWYRDANGKLSNVINHAYIYEKSVVNPKADYDSFSNDIDERIISTDNFAYAEAALALPAYLEGEIISATASGNAGEMYLGDDGVWYYRLDHGIDHSVLHDNGVENVYTDKVVIQVRNAAGEIEEIEKSIRIRDVSPVRSDLDIERTNVLEFVGEADAQRTSEGLVSTGFINMGADADPEAGAKITVTVGGETHEVNLFEDTEIRGEFGTLTFNANGQGRFAYQYKANDAVDGKETFIFAMTDSDGDTNNATLNIDLKFTEDFDPDMAQPLDPGLPPFGDESDSTVVPAEDGTAVALDEGFAVEDNAEIDDAVAAENTEDALPQNEPEDDPDMLDDAFGIGDEDHENPYDIDFGEVGNASRQSVNPDIPEDEDIGGTDDPEESNIYIEDTQAEKELIEGFNKTFGGDEKEDEAPSITEPVREVMGTRADVEPVSARETVEAAISVPDFSDFNDVAPIENDIATEIAMAHAEVA